MRISDWSSDVCSSDLPRRDACEVQMVEHAKHATGHEHDRVEQHVDRRRLAANQAQLDEDEADHRDREHLEETFHPQVHRSEEHTSELQSLMRISYAVFFLKKKTHSNTSTRIYLQQH